MFLTESVEDASLFATDFLPSVLKLAADVVPNVRIVAAKTLTSFTETGETSGYSLPFFCEMLS